MALHDKERERVASTSRSGRLFELGRKLARRGGDTAQTGGEASDAGTTAPDDRPDTIQRFLRAEILLHWAIAAPFLVCLVSAVVLAVVYNPDPSRPFRDEVSQVHRIAGICLTVLPVLAVLLNWKQWRIHLYNVNQGWVWHLVDFKWMLRMAQSAISSDVTLPDQGKFNAAEKLNFMMVMVTVPLFAITGLLIWQPGDVFGAWVVHFLMACLTVPLIGGHIFMATINPDTRVGILGMITGYVDREWAKHHYRTWYRERFESDEQAGEAAHPQRAALTSGSLSRAGTPARAGIRARRPAAAARPAAAVRPAEAVGPAAEVRAEPAAASASPATLASLLSHRQVDVARELYRFDPGAAIAMLEAHRSDYPQLLHALCRMQIDAGLEDDAIASGREALQICTLTGHADLAADLLRELWPHAGKLELSRKLVLASVGALLENRDLDVATKACTTLVRHKPGDEKAIAWLMTIAELRIEEEDDTQQAMSIYHFLEQNSNLAESAQHSARLREAMKIASRKPNDSG